MHSGSAMKVVTAEVTTDLSVFKWHADMDLKAI